MHSSFNSTVSCNCCDSTWLSETLLSRNVDVLAPACVFPSFENSSERASLCDVRLPDRPTPELAFPADVAFILRLAGLGSESPSPLHLRRLALRPLPLRTGGRVRRNLTPDIMLSEGPCSDGDTTGTQNQAEPALLVSVSPRMPTARLRCGIARKSQQFNSVRSLTTLTSASAKQSSKFSAAGRIPSLKSRRARRAAAACPDGTGANSTDHLSSSKSSCPAIAPPPLVSAIAASKSPTPDIRSGLFAAIASECNLPSASRSRIAKIAEASMIARQTEFALEHVDVLDS